MSDAEDSPHRRAAADFVRRVREASGDDIVSVLLYGSVARGDHRGVESDVDLLVVLDDDAHGVEDRVREIADDIELEHGVVLSLVVTTETEYRAGGPFLAHVRRDARALYGCRLAFRPAGGTRIRPRGARGRPPPAGGRRLQRGSLQPALLRGVPRG